MSESLVQALIVDDDQSWSCELASFLAEEGFAVHVAHNVQDAFNICRTHRPDYLLLDVLLLHENGLDLVDRMHEAGIFSAQVVVITGGADLGDIVRLRRQGVEDVMFKPVAAEDLIEKLVSSLRYWSLVFGRLSCLFAAAVFRSPATSAPPILHLRWLV